MAYVTLGLFCAQLMVCVALNINLIFALCVGLAIFWVYAYRQGFSHLAIVAMCKEGVLTIKNILLTFFFIGVLTGLWRAAGTIPTIIVNTIDYISPVTYFLMTFLLNCLISVLTGTSFGSCATMGVICAAIGATMNMPMPYVGGAVLSGIYFGDRCSPVSTSALLVAELTGTDIFKNIRYMLRTALVPFVVTCGLYLALGYIVHGESQSINRAALFAKEFNLSLLTILPAIVILVLSILHVPVRRAMLFSILTAVPLCIFVQQQSLSEVLQYAWSGYVAHDGEVGRLLNGGGITSMIRVGLIVCISSAYAGIFKTTGMLHGLQQQILLLAKRITSFGATMWVSVAASCIGCNQTLSIMLTHQLCKDTESDMQRFAIRLENTAVLIAALIPWSIAGVVPLAMLGASHESFFYAFFLFLTPLWGWGKALLAK